MNDKPTTERRRLDDTTKDDGYTALKPAAKEMKGLIYSGMMSESCFTAED